MIDWFIVVQPQVRKISAIFMMREMI